MKTMLNADWIIDLGPGAGEHGGWLVAEGRPEDIEAEAKSLTGAYLSGKKQVPLPQARRKGNGNVLKIRRRAREQRRISMSPFLWANWFALPVCQGRANRP